MELLSHRPTWVEGMSGSTRRTMLKRSLRVCAAAIGIDLPGNASASDASLRRTLRLFATSLGSRANGRARGQPPRPDDQVTTHGQLVGRPGGPPIGVFVGSAAVVRSPFLDGQSTVEQHVFVLEHGTLTGSGHAVAGVGTFAITGGTGRYAGARGNYTAVISPHGLGGDGTAEFNLTLTS
jgi:hypothetical protein